MSKYQASQRNHLYRIDVNKSPESGFLNLLSQRWPVNGIKTWTTTIIDMIWRSWLLLKSTPVLITAHKHDIIIMASEYSKEDSSMFSQVFWSQGQNTKWPNYSSCCCILFTAKELRVQPFGMHQFNFTKIWQVKWDFYVSLCRKSFIRSPADSI